jgi:uncharacterized cupin superfamily protein
MSSSGEVALSNVATDAWQPDPDVPATEMHELVRDGDVWVGMTRIMSPGGPISWTPDRRESVHVLEGSVRIEFEDGSDVELGPGDLASFPAGTRMTWHVTAPFKEVWFMA